MIESFFANKFYSFALTAFGGRCWSREGGSFWRQSSTAAADWGIMISCEQGILKKCAKHLSGTGLGRPFMEMWRQRKSRSSSFTNTGLIRRGSMVSNGTSPAWDVGISASCLVARSAKIGLTHSEPREVAGGIGFPHAPEDCEQFPREGMSGIGGIYGIGHHPFILGFQGVLFASQGGVHGAKDGAFEDAVTSLGQSKSSGSWSALFIGAAGLAFESDAAVFPEFAFGFESPGGVEIGQQSQGADRSDAGKFFPLLEDRFAADEFSELFSGQGDLGVGGVEADPEQLQLIGERWGFLCFEPRISSVEGVDNVGGDVEAESAGAGADATGLAGMTLNVSMVKADPLFQFDASVVVAVMDGPEESAAEESGEFGGVDFVVFVAVGGDEVVSAGITDDELIDVGAKVSAEPAGQGAFLDGEVLCALEGVEDLADGGDGGGDGVPGLDAAMGLNGDFGGVAMHVGSDIIGFHDGSFRMGLFCDKHYTQGCRLFIFSRMHADGHGFSLPRINANRHESF